MPLLDVLLFYLGNAITPRRSQGVDSLGIEHQCYSLQLVTPPAHVISGLPGDYNSPLKPDWGISAAICLETSKYGKIVKRPDRALPGPRWRNLQRSLRPSAGSTGGEETRCPLLKNPIPAIGPSGLRWQNALNPRLLFFREVFNL